MADWCRDRAKALAVRDIINHWKELNKILADEVIGRLSKFEYALPHGAMSDLRHLLAESQRLQDRAIRPLQSAVDEVKSTLNEGLRMLWKKRQAVCRRQGWGTKRRFGWRGTTRISSAAGIMPKKGCTGN